jgi:hypothetical protein
MAVLALFRVPRANSADAGHQDPWWPSDLDADL